MAFERLVPGTAEWGAYMGNHLSRYCFAVELLAGRPGPLNVLDAACGVGYGTAHLAQRLPADVLGVDLSEEALMIARERFAGPRIDYENDDCQKLAAAAKRAPFDAIVSFETVEHLPDPGALMRRCFELLKPNGVLIASTPNVTASPHTANWDAHEHAFRASDYRDLVGNAGFQRVEMYGQEWTPIGRLRAAVRAELNGVRSNPFQRVGRWLQRNLRGRKAERPVLPEDLDDFTVTQIASDAVCEAAGLRGPFVLIAVATP